MFWSDPEEAWAHQAWFSIQQTRQLAVRNRCAYTMKLGFSPDGGLQVLESGRAAQGAPARAAVK